ncbi:hypothetical protein L5515_014848 [Caenorhabditis briggsae]|uniref:Uncharacterized protein n=1 Tax=Caenorhabditis briggsae TaxID=6238 RepID=A0AAE9ED21_CAEBR|nr:hypothetical protein L5515_014848 [Caenorhabditis briggsae]
MEDRWLDDDDYGQKEYETLQNANFSMLDQEREEYDNFGNDYDTGFEIQYENERMELENDVMEYENNMMEFDKDETDAHQNRNLEFLPVLDDDFIWRTGPVIKSFTKDVYNQIVENCFSTTKKDDFSLPKFSEPGSKFAKFFVENGNVEDGLVWWKKAKEGRTRPRAREVSFNGTKVRYYSANSPILDEFKKYTIYPEGSEYYFVLYTSTHSNVDYTSLKIDKKNNISDSALKEVYGALDNRTVNSAYDFLKRNNVNVTKRQVRNQVRNQPRAVRSNRGRMCVTTPELLAELAFQKDISMFTTGNWFGLVYIDMDLIRCFVKGLPSSEDVKDYRKGLSGCSSWDQQKLNDFVESYRKETNSGIVNRMAGQLQLDSTFDLCDLVVTVLSGDFSSYRTVSSGKIRHSVLGFMLSTSKCADVHQKFADEIDKAFLKIDPRTKKTMPSFVVDEEDSFKVYSNLKYLERTQKLRCLIHRRQNFQDASKSNKLDRKTVDAVFGKTETNGEVLGGCLNVLNKTQLKPEYQD